MCVVKVRGWSVVAVALVPLLVMCGDDDVSPPPPVTVTSGAGGSGGCPDNALPEPLFTITVRTEDGAPLPPDTALRVRWSAGEEPVFALDDASTWLTLEDNVNVECDVDRDQPPPTDLHELACELWTAGATEVEVSATGYVPRTQTLAPRQVDGCEEPVPSDVELILEPDPDA